MIMLSGGFVRREAVSCNRAWTLMSNASGIDWLAHLMRSQIHILGTKEILFACEAT